MKTKFLIIIGIIVTVVLVLGIFLPHISFHLEDFRIGMCENYFINECVEIWEDPSCHEPGGGCMIVHDTIAINMVLNYCERKQNAIDSNGIDEDGNKIVMPAIGLDYQNSTHRIDNNTCEWKLLDVDLVSGLGLLQENNEPDLTDKTKYRPIFTDDGPVQGIRIQEDGGETRTGAVLEKENCIRYTVWLNEFQKREINRYDDNSGYPPWGNQIFPMVDYCESIGEFYHTLEEGQTTEITWSFVLNGH